MEWIGESVLLEIPYHKSEELIMDIMRYLPHVEVLQPEELKAAVADRIRLAYEKICK